MTIGISAALVLSGCAAGDAGPDRSPSATRTATADGTAVTDGATSIDGATATTGADPSPTSTIPQVPGVDHDGGTLPSSCSSLVTAGRWQFTDDPLNDPSVVGDPVTVPKTAFTPVLQPGGGRLYCVWRDPRVDVTNVVIDVAVVDSTKAFAALQQLSGFDCDRESEGYRCQKISQNPQYPVTDGDTYFTRGDIGIRITQSNVPTDGLLEDVEAHVFG